MVADKKVEVSRMVKAGRRLIQESDDDIVISGIAGNFPDADGLSELSYKLMNKIEMISDDDRRWKLDHPEIPQRTGKLKEVNKFDASSFGVHHNQAECMDPMSRILLEKSYEAIIDSGNNPYTLRGSKTGVFVGVCFSESEKTWFYEKLQVDGFGVTGCIRTMVANRVSYAFGFDGPSYVVDTACSSSMYALEQAYNAIREGICDNAIVGGCNLCLHPYVSLQFARLGVLSQDGKCKVFDENANGYCRSEAIAAIFLQKKRNSKRIYANVVHVKTNCDGYKEQGITYPSGETQQNLLQDFYEECLVDPASLAWVEAHGTGTKVGDPEEVQALYNVFCKNRTTPLKIGSVKSNLGHSEPTSGMCSIAKVVIAMETGLIPPNINFNTPRADIEYFKTGEIQVVTEPTPWEGGKVGVNSFGFGGANCHALLEWNSKTKKNGGLPEDDLPRLVNISGRTEEAVSTILQFLEEHSIDVELIKLFHDIHKNEIPSHLYRGFVILTKDKSYSQRLIEDYGLRKNVYINFSALTTNWKPYDKSIFQFPVFHQSLLRMSKAIAIDLPHLITDSTNEMVNPVDYFVATVATQIALYDLLVSINVSVDGYFGSSFGILVCAYVDGCMTAEEVIKATYQIASSLGPLAAKGSQNTITSSISLLSKSLISAKSKIMDYLNKVIPVGKSRSPKWLTDTNGSTNFNAEFLFNNIYKNLIKYADISFDEYLFEEDIAILNMGSKGGYENLDYYAIDIVDSSGINSCTSFLAAVGRLFMVGCESDPSKLYPEVSYPVSRSTPMIAPLVRWDHSDTWYVPSYQFQKRISSGERMISVSLAENESEYIGGHVIDHRNLFPATGYLALVWETLGLMKGELYTELPVVFEKLRFHRATTMTNEGNVDFTVIIQRVSGKFEIVEGGAAVVSGRITTPSDIDAELTDLEAPLKYENECPLSTKDVYKELRLRGYNYNGLFRSIIGVNLKDKVAKVRWHKNWVAFMDNMLQVQLMFQDTRGLFVPTSIDRVVIDGKKHCQLISAVYGEEEEKDVAVHYWPEVELLKGGGIEIRGLRANAIPRRKILAEPVLEKHQFVPNFTENQEYSVEQIVRIFTQIILENEQNINVKAIEIASKNHGLLAPTVADVLSDLPLIQTDITVIGNASNYEETMPPGVTIEDKKLSSDQSAILLLANNIFDNSHDVNLEDCLSALKPEGYFIVREDVDTKVDTERITVLSSQAIEGGKMLLLKKIKKNESGITEVFHISNDDYSWIAPSQTAMKSKDCTKVIFIGDGEEESGVMGFVNCLRKEPEGLKARCVLLMDGAPEFSLEDDFYGTQLSKDLAINVYKNGKWGTYRHLKIEEGFMRPAKHIYANLLVRGDLSSLSWLQGPISDLSTPDIVTVHYSALNFRDVMLASGKLAAEIVVANRKKQECVIGLEFSGIDARGRRVMGLVTTGGLSSVVSADTGLLWEFPDEWSLADAATVPVVYGTVLYAMMTRGRMRRGDSILIHSGTGGVGQAAINIALFNGCTVYTTVGTQEKRDFIKKQFPELTDRQIGNSRDTSFEQMIMRETNGRGVDMVLNSLAEEKLLASVRCLAQGGRFLEIGKFDLSNDNPLGMEIFAKGASFHAIILDSFFDKDSPEKVVLNNLIIDNLRNGSIKPIMKTVFPHDQIEAAFRYMATGKHMGKVLIDMRGDHKDVPPNVPITREALPRFYCKKDKTYIIIGGLGGFGLELADWLVLKCACNLVLTSRRGVTNGYQAYRIGLWKKYGLNVEVFTDDITTEEGIKALLRKASKIGPVAGIFNLAVVLKDGIFENQNATDFACSLGPKAMATKYLDRLSREMCPELEQFIVFSSVSCGRGNAGQTNYGMANSVMERICERRVAEGFPALAIQWGAVGDVGLVAEMMDDHNVEVVIGGTLQQRIMNCLEVMDQCLMYQNGVVSSMVVAEKKSRNASTDNLVDTVINILGIRDLKTVSIHSNLAELGMDSMMAVEIKQTLEREFEVFLSPQDIRGLTIAKLQEITAAKQNEEKQDIGQDSMNAKLENTGEAFVQKVITEPGKYEPIVKLPSLNNIDNQSRSKVFFIPGVEGFSVVFESLAKYLNFDVYCLQLDYTTYYNKLGETADALIKPLIPELSQKQFNILGYSYGGLVAIELVRRLEQLGYQGNLILIDSAPQMMKELSKNEYKDEVGEEFEINLILKALELIGAHKLKIELEGALRKIPGWDQKIEMVMQLYTGRIDFSETFRRQLFNALRNRILSIHNNEGYREKFISSKVSLIRPTEKTLIGSEDYELSKICRKPVSVHFVEGNHATILNNPKTASVIAEIINGEKQTTEKTALLHPTIDINIVKENIKQI